MIAASPRRARTTRDAARQMQIGQAQQYSSTGTEFAQKNICPNVRGIMDCEKILIQVNATSDYYQDSDYLIPNKNKNIKSTSFTYCNGHPGQQIILRSIYMAPFFLGKFLQTGYIYKNSPVFPLVSTAAFVDEYFPLDMGSC